METHCVSVFKSNQWFSKTEGDGKLVKEIPAEVDGEELLKSMCPLRCLQKLVDQMTEDRISNLYFKIYSLCSSFYVVNHL